MDQPTVDLPPSSNGDSPGSTTDAASPEELMKVLIRQHRVINNLKDQLANVLLGLAETQASLEETREELGVARSEAAQLHEANNLHLTAPAE